MDFLTAVFVAPVASMWDNPGFLLEVVIGGLLTGVMYSLVALGFVLIYKASGVFNFAQGTMVLFAALTFVGLIERGIPVWASFLLAALVMVALAFAIERVVLRPLVNQEQIILFMATIGLTFFLDGFGQLVWGGDVHPLDIGIPKEPIIIGGVLINEFDLIAALVCGTMVAALALFFQKTAIGRALRAGRRSLLGPRHRRRHRGLVRLRIGAGVPAVPPAGPVRRADHRESLTSRAQRDRWA